MKERKKALGQTVYIAVTADRYELPRYITETQKEMAEYLGEPADTLRCRIIRGAVKRNEPLKGCKFIRVELDDEELPSP